MASRGLTVKSFLKKDIWASGPQFLLLPQEEWPQNPDGLEEISPKDSEVKSITVNAAQIMSEEVDPITRLIHYFSSWTRLRRAAAWMLKLKRLLLYCSRKRKQASGVLTQLHLDNIHQRDLQRKETGDLETQENSALTVEELANAEMEIICFCQKKRFVDEISSLRKGMNVKRTSHIHKLNPILENGKLRVGGRLSRAAMPEEMKHPVILAKDFHISDLIL